MRTRIALTLATSLLLATALTACAPGATHDDAPKAAASTQSTPVSGDYVLDASHASITFTLLHMGYSHYTGRFNAIDAALHFDEANVSKSTLKATVRISSIDTHNSTLEAELISKDWFNAGEFPTATFTATRIEKTGANTGKITGDLTLAGVTKPVVLDTVLNKGGPDPLMHKDRLGFSAKTVIKRSDFGISKYVPMVGDDVALDIEAEFTRKE